MFPYRNQSVDLHFKLINWFLYDWSFGHYEKVKMKDPLVLAFSLWTVIDFALEKVLIGIFAHKKC